MAGDLLGRGDEDPDDHRGMMCEDTGKEAPANQGEAAEETDPADT